MLANCTTRKRQQGGDGGRRRRKQRMLIMLSVSRHRRGTAQGYGSRADALMPDCADGKTGVNGFTLCLYSGCAERTGRRRQATMFDCANVGTASETKRIIVCETGIQYPFPNSVSAKSALSFAKRVPGTLSRIASRQEAHYRLRNRYPVPLRRNVSLRIWLRQSRRSTTHRL